MGQFTWKSTTLPADYGDHPAMRGEADGDIEAVVGEGYAPGYAGMVFDPSGRDREIEGLPNIEAAMDWAEAHAAGSFPQ